MEITYTEMYQLFFLKRSINEQLELYDENKKKYLINNINIKIDHIPGDCYINDMKYSLIFPKYLLNTIEKIDKNKGNNYYFKGVINEKRQWIKKYNYIEKSYIQNSLSGRNTNTKYTIDIDYYTDMCKSKFTLCPTNDCPWSYRFFEAIMCLSIPILDKNTDDKFYKNYYYFYDEDNKDHIYDLKKAKENYAMFINNKNHFLDKSFIENILNKENIIMSYN